MAIALPCPACGAVIDVPPDATGPAACPRCGAAVVLPAYHVVSTSEPQPLPDPPPGPLAGCRRTLLLILLAGILLTVGCCTVVGALLVRLFD
jgi:hypothetical protein